MKRRRLLALLGGLAAAGMLLSACEGGPAAQTSAPVPSAPTAAETALETPSSRMPGETAEAIALSSFPFNGREIPVHEITPAEVDALCGYLEGTTKETPVSQRFYVDEDGNLYVFDYRFRLTEYRAVQPEKSAVKLQSGAEKDDVVAALPDILGGRVEHLDAYAVWEDPEEPAAPNTCALRREISEHQNNVIDIAWDGTGAVTSIWVTYASDTDVPIPDAVKDALRADAQAELEARAKAQDAAEAKILGETFSEYQHESTHEARGNFTFYFADANGASWDEGYLCAQPLST